MHTFQPIPVDMLDMNPFTKIGKEWALLTAGNKQESNTMTISWGGVGVLWGKNVVYVFVRDSRYTKELIDAGDFFSLTFVSDQYRDALNYCGSHSGRTRIRLQTQGLPWTTGMESHTLMREILFWSVKKCLLPESRMIPSSIPRLLTNGTKTAICTPCTLDRSLMCSQDDHFC